MKKLIFLLYFIVGFVPILDAADRSSTQILYLQFLNLISIGYYLIELKNKQKKNFIKNLKEFPFLLLLIFTIWSTFTISIAGNTIESLKTIAYILTYLTAFPILYYLINTINNAKSFILNSITFIVFLEVFAVVFPFINDIITEGSFLSRSQRYSGFTGNINIAAFSILMKLPLIIYNLLTTQKRTWAIFNLIIVFFSIYSIISIHQTRGAILGLIIIFLILIIYFLVQFKNKKINLKYFSKGLLIFTIPLIINLFINNFQTTNFSNQKGNSIAERLETIVSQNDESKNSRLRYWEQSIITALKNPLFGIGIGNWKLKGIESDVQNLNNYIVPYHSHNDFLEIFAETGIIGFLSFTLFYTSLFVILIFYLYKRKLPEFQFFLMLALLIYIIDATLNFPFARPIQQISFLIISILSYILLSPKFAFKPPNYRLRSTLWIILMLLSPLSFYSAIRIFKSSQQQYILLSEFNTNSYTKSLEEVDTYESYYPNLSETTIPLVTFKGLYHLRNNDYQKALEYFHEGKKANPYLFINESYIGYIYSRLNIPDSSLYYSKLAFEKYPNNINHFGHYVISLTLNRDSLEIKNAYNKIKQTYPDAKSIDQIYYLALANLLDKDDSKSFLDETSKNILKSDNTDELTRINYYVLEFGKEKLIKADILYQEGLKNFEQKKFLEAAQNFEKAAEINPLELPYFENAANAYMQISKLDEALKNINYVIENSDKPNGKALYIKALIFLEKGEIITTCKLLDESEKAGFRGARNLKSSYCK